MKTVMMRRMHHDTSKMRAECIIGIDVAEDDDLSNEVLFFRILCLRLPLCLSPSIPVDHFSFSSLFSSLAFSLLPFTLYDL